MKNITSLLMILSLSYFSMAGDWPYKRLDRLYSSNSSKCLKASKRYIKFIPEKSAPYYFAASVYKDRSEKLQFVKAKYFAMNKAMNYAVKFESLKDIDMMRKVNWGKFMQEMNAHTDQLIVMLDEEEMGSLASYIDNKRDGLNYEYNQVVLIDEDYASNDAPSVIIDEGNSSPSENNSGSGATGAGSGSTIAANGMYYGVPTGNEVSPSYNKIQEKQLLDLINDERKELGMQPLKLSGGLARAARYHANDMAIQNYFEHDTYDRISGDLVYVTEASTTVSKFYDRALLHSQSIAAGPQSAIEAYQRWYNDDRYYQQMFDEDARKVGLGLYYDASSEHGYYWVMCTTKK